MKSVKDDTRGQQSLFRQYCAAAGDLRQHYERAKREYLAAKTARVKVRSSVSGIVNSLSTIRPFFYDFEMRRSKVPMFEYFLCSIGYITAFVVRSLKFDDALYRFEGHNRYELDLIAQITA